MGFLGLQYLFWGKKLDKKVCFVQNSSGVVLQECDILTCQRLHNDDICKHFGWKQRRKFVNIHLQNNELNICFSWKRKDFFLQLQQQSLFSIRLFFCSKMNPFSKIVSGILMFNSSDQSKLWYK